MSTTPFEEHAERYDRWFDDHPEAYRSETEALSRLVPTHAFGVEIGVGSGRFAAPLDVDVGVDPATPMLARAAERDVEPVRGVAEALPLGTDRFDVALLVTTICFVDDVPATLAEARRVLRPGGALVIGLLDGDSPVGQRYRAHKDESPFYRDATFASTGDLLAELATAGFTDVDVVQTVFGSPDDMDAPDPVRDGHGEGLFVGLRAVVGE